MTYGTRDDRSRAVPTSSFLTSSAPWTIRPRSSKWATITYAPSMLKQYSCPIFLTFLFFTRILVEEVAPRLCPASPPHKIPHILVLDLHIHITVLLIHLHLIQPPNSNSPPITPDKAKRLPTSKAQSTLPSPSPHRRFPPHTN